MINTKKCTGPCGRELANTSENFEPSKGKNALRGKCRACRSYEERVRRENTDPSLKYCTGSCGRFLPATSEYFYEGKRNKDGWNSWCKDCFLAYSKRNNTIDGFTIAQLARRIGVTKDSIRGRIADGTLPAFKIPSKYSKEDGEWCISLEDAEAYASIINESKSDTLYEIDEAILHEEIDEVAHIIGSPDQCGACGVTRKNILGDVSEVTHKQYGYLCTRCHRLVQDFHEDITRMRNVLNYLEKSRLDQV